MTPLIQAIFQAIRFSKVFQAIKLLCHKGPSVLIVEFQDFLSRNILICKINHLYNKWMVNNYPSKVTIKNQNKKSALFKYQPKISIITPTFKTPEKYLIDCIESVINQSYPNWELCIADDNSQQKVLMKIIKDYSQKDKRIKYTFRSQNGHISLASNDALSLATGDYVCFLDHDDILWPNSLFEIVKSLNQKKSLFLYTDEDKIDEKNSKHIEPFFKPNWNLKLFQQVNYLNHLTIINKEIIDEIGGFKKGFEGAQDWDLFFRAIYNIEQKSDNDQFITHIPKILYSWRQSPNSTASNKYAAKVKQYAYDNQKKVLKYELQRRNIEGEPKQTKYLGIWTITSDINRYESQISNPIYFYESTLTQLKRLTSG
jgi:glycosyltransferase involved in cell wall biosynthesis